jgi:NADH-quinone oxidoreductase subunit N
MSIILSIFLLSLAGLPPLLGFFSKFLIFQELVAAHMYVLCIFSILCSIINSFVYIRFVKCLFFDKPVSNNPIIARQKDFFLSHLAFDEMKNFNYL